jgi:hypothetical protein
MDRSLAGMLAAQALFLVAGIGVLSALRSFGTWAAVLRGIGLAYLLGVATVGVLATLVLVAGSGVATPIVVALALGVAVLGAGVARVRGHGIPRASGFSRPVPTPELLFATALGLLTVAVLVAFFLVARHQGLVAWDAWAFWVPKAQAIYFFGGLDETLFRSLANPSYPVLIPAVQAMDFHLMGSADAATLAVQYWFLLVGFVSGGWYLLRPLVRPGLLLPFIALATVMPELDKRMINAQADWPLDIFFAIAALALGRWLMTREGWLLGVYGVLLTGAMATKREGQLLAACLLAAALLVTLRSARSSWPWLVGITVFAFAVNLPWRFWWMSRHLSPDTPEVSLSNLPDYSSRVAPAFRIVFELLFDYHLWLVAVPVAVAVALLAIAHGELSLAVLYLATLLLAVVGFMWVLWAFPSLPLDKSQQEPIPREVGSVVLLSILFAPLLLSRLVPQRHEPLMV